MAAPGIFKDPRAVAPRVAVATTPPALPDQALFPRIAP